MKEQLPDELWQLFSAALEKAYRRDKREKALFGLPIILGPFSKPVAYVLGLYIRRKLKDHYSDDPDIEAHVHGIYDAQAKKYKLLLHLSVKDLTKEESHKLYTGEPPTEFDQLLDLLSNTNNSNQKGAKYN